MITTQATYRRALGLRFVARVKNLLSYVGGAGYETVRTGIALYTLIGIHPGGTADTH